VFSTDQRDCAASVVISDDLTRLNRPRPFPILGTAMQTPAKQLNIAPERSLDQRMDALQRANLVRSQRARLKVDLKRGAVTIGSVLREPPEFLLTAKVIDVLMAAPKCGRVKSARIMEQCRVSPSKTVGGLSDRQRSELLGFFGS